MNQELLNRVNIVLKTHPDLLGEPASDAEIIDAENTLRLNFNKQYIEFIKLFGGSFAGISIHAFSNGSLIGKATVVELTSKFREDCKNILSDDILNSLYAISDDGSGNPVLMNTLGHIYIYYHDSGELEQIYSSLEELLEKSFLSR